MLALFGRRCFAWPLVAVGAICVQLGGTLIRAGAWIMDIDTSIMQ